MRRRDDGHVRHGATNGNPSCPGIPLTPGLRVFYWPGAATAAPRSGVLTSEPVMFGGHTLSVWLRDDDPERPSQVVMLSHVRPFSPLHMNTAIP